MLYLTDNWIRVLNVQNRKSQAIISNATVTLIDIIDLVTGVRAPGLTPGAFSPIAGTPGGYDFLIDRDVVTLVRGRKYTITVDVNGGAGLRRRSEIVVTVVI